MTTTRIIPALDKGKAFHARLPIAMKALPINQLAFEPGKETAVATTSQTTRCVTAAS